MLTSELSFCSALQFAACVFRSRPVVGSVALDTVGTLVVWSTQDLPLGCLSRCLHQLRLRYSHVYQRTFEVDHNNPPHVFLLPSAR